MSPLGDNYSPKHCVGAQQRGLSAIQKGEPPRVPDIVKDEPASARRSYRLDSDVVIIIGQYARLYGLRRQILVSATERRLFKQNGFA